MNPIDRMSRVADVVLEHPECARIFQHYRVDYCCRGDMSIEEACRGRGVASDLVLADLEAAVAARSVDDAPRLDRLPTDALVATIVGKHHAYLRATLPFLDALVVKVARVHGDHEPRLVALRDVFQGLRAELEPHLDEEERVLFPSLTSKAPDRAAIARGLAFMKEEHRRVGDALARLRELADDYAPPDWACNSYRTLLRELANLEADTLRHVHAENHVLLPRFAA